MGEIKEEVVTLRANIHSFIERNILTIPPVVPLIIQSEPPHRPIYFDLFLVNEDTIPIVGMKKAEKWSYRITICYLIRP